MASVKRKPSHMDLVQLPAKKPRVDLGAPRPSSQPLPTLANTSRPHEDLIARLSSKYEVKSMSVQTSTKISKHIEKALLHLGQFHPWDEAVLPGVVLLYAKAEAANKLTTISETIRRRIHESEKKWFSYNVLSDSEVEMAPEDPSRVEETVIANDMQADDEEMEAGEDGDGYFQSMGAAPTVFKQAVLPPQIKHKAFLSAILSRVPIPELEGWNGCGTQTNDADIKKSWRDKTGYA